MKRINHILVQVGILAIFLSVTSIPVTATPIHDGSSTFRLGYMTSVPPTLITKNVTEISATSATSGGNVFSDGGAPVTARGVCWSTSPNPTLADSHTVDGGGTGPFSSLIEGLSPQQTYYVRAYATNSEGTSYGSELQFTTACIPIVTWDTVSVSPLEMPYAYADIVLQTGTPDSSTFVFTSESLSNGCDSTSNVLFVFKADHVTACQQYLWSIDGQTYTESGLYLHLRTDDLGEDVWDTLVLTIVTPSVSISPLAPVTVCLGQDIDIPATATATGTVSYLWNGPGPHFTSLDSVLTITNASLSDTGVYTVTASILGSCTATATATVHISVVAPSTVEISGNNPICPGGSDTLTASGADSYLWEGETLSPSYIVSPLTNTTYHLVATDLHGCTTAIEVPIQVNPLPEVFISGKAEICLGDSVELNAAGATTYLWSTGATGSILVDYPTGNTVYSVTGTDANPCQNSYSVTVIVRGSSEGENDCISSGGGTSWGDNSEVFVSTCESYYWQATGQTYTQSGTYGNTLGDTLHLTIYHGDALETSKTACQSYTWDVTGQTYTESGDYVFPYINNNGCPSTRTLHLTLSTPAVTVQPIAPVTVCSGEDVAFSATATGTGPINYSWKGPNAFSSSDNSISIPDATAGASGVYTLTATTVMGTCIATATTTVQITVVASPQIEVTGNHPLCAGDSLTLTATGAQTYHWSNGITSPSITVFPSLSTTYTVTGTDNHGCAGTAEVLVTVNSMPVVAISGNTSICKGKSTTLYVSGASSYVWSTGFNGSSLAVAPSNSATYSVTGTSAYGCSAADTIVVTVHPKPDVDVAGNSPVCAGESVTLSASGADSYVWSSGGGTGSSITLNPTSSKSYTVTGTTIYGCTATASKSITVHPKPNVSMVKSGPICAGDALILTASGANSYAWSNGMTGNPIVEFPYQNTKFVVVGTNSYGCTGSDSLSIQVNPLPNIFIMGEAEVCYGEEITLTAAGASTYSWSSGSGSSTMTDNPTSDIEYTVTGTDANSCENTASVTVTVRELPDVEILGNDVICEGEETRLRASGAMSYVWDDESTASSILVAPTSTTTYSVTGTDSYGCVNEASLTVIMGSGEHETHHTVTACESYYWEISEDTYTASGTYPFNYTNNFGCVDYHILHLTINHIDTIRTKLTECDSYTWSRNGHTYTESTIDTASYINENNCETVEILTLTIKKGTHQTDSVPACDSYLWLENGETYTESGKHVFQYTNSDGCPSSKTLVLDMKHGTFNETRETGINSYTWSATGETYYVSGDYMYYYVNEEGCPSATSMHLTIEHRSDSCIYATANDVSCENRHDGRVSVFIPASIKNQCTVEWTLPDSTIRTEETLTGVSKGLYTVKVRSSLCQNVILFQDNVVVKNPCGVNVTISGPSEVTYSPCDGLPRVTFSASITGGTPPYTIPGWNVNGTSATQTRPLQSGSNAITCHVIDAEGDSGDDALKVFAKKIECAKDPNEIKGPSGYSEEEHFVNVTDKMNYTISFENDPDFAMAPASRVKITYDVPDEQRLASFRLTDFGFGDFMFTAPSNAASYSQRLDVSDSLGVWVDVNAGIDVVHRQLFWIFQSIDPATGAEPASSQMGFLSINDSLGHGEGYVSFYMIPESGLQTGDTVAAEAIIVFDDNAPIGTNVWRNTFDAVAPTSTLHAELNEQDSLYCTFTFTAQDDAGGSGVQSVEVYMSVNNGAYTSIGSRHPDSTLTYAMENGLNYRFVSAATDNVGNTEPLKAQPDTTINFNTAPIDLVLDGNVFYENVPLNTYIGTFITLDDDINQPFTYELVSGAGSADNGLFQIVHNELRTNALFECSNRDEYEIRVRTTDIGGLSFEKAFIVSEIILHETPVTYERVSICQGDSYAWNGMTLTADGVYSVTIAKEDGCDSVVTLFLTVNPVYQRVITETICEGGSYNFFGQNYSQTGIYTHALQSVNGCDSIFTLNLMVNPASATTLTATACNSYDLNNTTYTHSGVYKQYFSNRHGCDSVVTLNLTIFNSDSTEFTETACDSYVWNNQTYTQSGDYRQTFTNVEGCDSLVILHLTVLNSTYYVDTQTACDTYTWIDGNTYTESNYTATHTLTNAAGCDSVVTLNLTVNHSNTGIDVQTACETYTWIDGNTYTESNNTATYTLTNATGCDSVVSLNLTVSHSTAGVDVQTACNTYTWIDGNVYTESNNTATYTLTNAAGCDSVVTLNLTVNHSTADVDMQTACDTYTWIDGNTYTESNNTAIYTLTNTAGCDSVVTLNLTVIPSTHNVETESACESFIWHGTTYTTSGTYTYAYTNANGCESADTLHLTVNHGTHNVDTETACEAFTWHGETYTTSGTYTYAYNNADGCASVDTLHLTVLSTVAELVEATACDSYTWNGSTYTASGEYVQTFTGANGCDSVVTLDLTINYSATSDFEVSTTDSCYEWNSVNYCESGDYTQTLQTTAGCDSVVTLHLTITVSIDDHELSGIEVFPNPTNHILNIKGEGMRHIDIFNADGQLVYTKENDGSNLVQVDVTRFAAGQYFVKVRLGDGRTATRKVVVSRR